MPFYTCHKRVQALEIGSLGSYTLSQLTGGLLREVFFADGSAKVLKDELFRRYVPQPGDFYVVYEDGYESFSPRKAFLEGYTLDPPEKQNAPQTDQA